MRAKQGQTEYLRVVLQVVLRGWSAFLRPETDMQGDVGWVGLGWARRREGRDRIQEKEGYR